METLLLASHSAFDLDEVCSLMPAKLHPDLQDKVGGIRHLVLKGETRFIAQIQACDEEEDGDTIDDLLRLQDPPAEFADALAERSLRFLIVTYAPAEQAALQEVIDTLAKAGVIQFCIDKADRVHLLAT